MASKWFSEYSKEDLKGLSNQEIRTLVTNEYEEICRSSSPNQEDQKSLREIIRKINELNVRFSPENHLEHLCMQFSRRVDAEIIARDAAQRHDEEHQIQQNVGSLRRQPRNGRLLSLLGRDTLHLAQDQPQHRQGEDRDTHIGVDIGAERVAGRQFAATLGNPVPLFDAVSEQQVEKD